MIRLHNGRGLVAALLAAALLATGCAGDAAKTGAEASADVEMEDSRWIAVDSSVTERYSDTVELPGGFFRSLEFDSDGQCEAGYSSCEYALRGGRLVIIDQVSEYDYEIQLNENGFTLSDGIYSVQYQPSADSEKPDERCTGDLYYVVENGEVTITGFVEFSSVIEVPETIGGKPVTRIGEKAFYASSIPREITLPEGIVSIGDEAFSGCSNLEKVSIPDGVQSIGNEAFSNCRYLRSIEIPGSVKSIGDEAFYACGFLTTVSFQEGTTHIGSEAFLDCDSLESVYISSSVEEIGANAFTCGKKGCSVEVSPENTHYRMQDGVLLSYDGQTLYSFPDCDREGTYSVPEGVTEIFGGAFCQSSLSEITIPDGVKRIGSHAFENCDDLQSVSIPASVEEIGYLAFLNCSALREILISPENDRYRVENGVLIDSDGLLRTFLSGLGLESCDIPKDVVRIDDWAFADLDTLKSVTIPDGVKRIGAWAFCNCMALTTVSVPASVETIGDDAFCDFENLTIFTPEDSAAYRYAAAYGILCVAD